MKLLGIDAFGGADERITLQKFPIYAKSISDLRVSETGGLEKRRSLSDLYTLPGGINGIWKGVVGGLLQTVIVAGGKVYRAIDGVETTPVEIGTAVNAKCTLFKFGDNVYIKALNYYGKYDGYTASTVDGYIPTVALNCTPAGEGYTYEQVNLLTRKRKQFFSCDGVANDFKLAENDISSVDLIKLDGAEVTAGYTIDLAHGHISFTSVPSEGINNLEIVYSCGGNNRSRILNCQNAVVFGGNSDSRVFLWGNPLFPNYRFNSELADGVANAEYFPVNGYTVIGSGTINCISQQYGKQMIFTDDKAYYSPCELTTDALGKVYSSFPVYDLNGRKGSIILAEGCVIDGKPVTLCEDGINVWEQTSLENERNAVCISKPVGASIAGVIGNLYFETPKIFDFQAFSELFVIAGNKAYVFDYRNKKWFIYGDFGCDAYFVFGQTLLLGVGDKIKTFSEDSGDTFESGEIEFAPFYLSDYGKADAVVFEADVETAGDEKITFYFRGRGEEKAGGFEFSVSEAGHKRIEFRPRARRASPLGLTVRAEGDGYFKLDRIALKFKERKRSERHGIQ